MKEIHATLCPKNGRRIFMFKAAEALQSRVAQIPILTTLGFRVVSLSEGVASLTASHNDAYSNAFHNFHGGMLMTLADTAAFIAVLTMAGVDAVITTTDMNIRFLAPSRCDVIAEAKVIKFGRTLCPVSVNIRDTHANHIAIAQVTYIRLNNFGRSVIGEPHES